MKINFPAEPTPKINYLSKQNLTAPLSESNGRLLTLRSKGPKYNQLIVCCVLRVAPFTTSHIALALQALQTLYNAR